MAENYDIKYSEECYATKEQVMDALNLSSVDFFWNQVLVYRKRRTLTFDLHNIDNLKFSLVMTDSITNRLLSFERRLTRQFFEYTCLTPSSKKLFLDKRMVKILGQVGSFSTGNISDSLIVALVENSLSTIPTDALIIDHYYSSLKYIKAHDGGSITYVDFNALYFTLNNGEEPPSPLTDKEYRTNNYETPHYFQKGYVYSSALTERIDPMMEDLTAFVNDSKQYSSIRAIASLFYAYYVMPYELFREHFSCLAFKEALSKSGFGPFGAFINIETLMMTGDKKLKETMDNVQKTLDLTYFFDYVLNYLLNDLDDLEEDIVKSSNEEVINEAKNKEAVNNELKPSDNSIINPILSEEPENLGNPSTPGVASPSILNPNEPPAIQIYGKTDVALPIFPTGLKVEDVDRIAIDLRETYPTLSKTQAHFYASHCTIGRSYTIQEYKNSESTSYETARTSMDYLVTMGFFEKAKVRNKFVYKPIPRRK